MRGKYKNRTRVKAEKGFGPRHALNAQEGSEAVPSELPTPPVDPEEYHGLPKQLRRELERAGGELAGMSKEDYAKLAISILAGGEEMPLGGEAGAVPATVWHAMKPVGEKSYGGAGAAIRKDAAGNHYEQIGTHTANGVWHAIVRSVEAPGKSLSEQGFTKLKGTQEPPLEIPPEESTLEEYLKKHPEVGDWTIGEEPPPPEEPPAKSDMSQWSDVQWTDWENKIKSEAQKGVVPPEEGEAWKSPPPEEPPTDFMTGRKWDDLIPPRRYARGTHAVKGFGPRHAENVSEGVEVQGFQGGASDLSAYQQGLVERMQQGGYDYTFGPGSPGATREDLGTYVGGPHSPAGGFAREGGYALAPRDYYSFTPEQRQALGIMDIAPANQAGQLERYYGGGGGSGGGNLQLVNDLGYNPSYPYGSSGSGVPTQKAMGLLGGLIGTAAGSFIPGGGLVGGKLGAVGARMLTRRLQQQSTGGPAPAETAEPGAASAPPTAAFDPGYSSPEYLRSIGYTPGQGTGSLWPGQRTFTGGAFWSPPGGSIGGTLSASAHAATEQVPFFSRMMQQRAMSPSFAPQVAAATGSAIADFGSALGGARQRGVFAVPLPVEQRSGASGLGDFGTQTNVQRSRPLMQTAQKGETDVKLPKDKWNVASEASGDRELWDRILTAMYGVQTPAEIMYPDQTTRTDEGAEPVMAKRGTDTVPAMLTPREAVLNRNAAELAGRGNIEQLNEKGNALAEEGVDLAGQRPAVVGGKNMKQKPKKYQGGAENVTPLGMYKNRLGYQGGTSSIGYESPEQVDPKFQPVQLSGASLAALKKEGAKQGLSSEQIGSLVSALGSAYGGGGGADSGIPAMAYQSGISDIGYPPFIAPDAEYHADKGGGVWNGPYDPNYLVQRYWRGTAGVSPMTGLGSVMSTRHPMLRHTFPGTRHKLPPGLAGAGGPPVAPSPGILPLKL